MQLMLSGTMNILCSEVRTVLHRQLLPLLTQSYRKHLPGSRWHDPLREVSYGRIFERYDG